MSSILGTTGSSSSSVASDLMQFAPVEMGGDIVFLLSEEEGLANLISSLSSSLDRKRLMQAVRNVCMGRQLLSLKKLTQLVIKPNRIDL